MALRRRLDLIVEPWKLPFKGGEGDIRTPAVFEQYAPVENDDQPDAPAVIARIGKVKQADDVRSGVVTVIALVYSEDSEQGYRDAENLIEAIETDLITAPWLDEGAYKLVGPWETDISDNKFPVFFATLTCSAELPSVECRVGPDGNNIEV